MITTSHETNSKYEEDMNAIRDKSATKCVPKFTHIEIYEMKCEANNVMYYDEIKPN